MTRSRDWAWRVLLSALAGGGLAGLGGPLAGAALAADAPVSSPATGEGASAPIAVSTPPATPAAGTSESEAAQPPTTTSTSTAPATTTPQPSTAAPTATEAPTVVVQRRQKTTAGGNESRSLTTTQAKSPGGQPATGAGSTSAGTRASGPNDVAPSPQQVAAQAAALAAELASSEASAQALGFYRIPLFLLPIYQAAAIQYGVPWQILAAINEIETDYGSDLSVSSAGAEGWMQFEPSTWLQYGVDALDAGYADPYNPVDAIFAAARYLHAAGASTDLRAAILAYNHSAAYVSSVLLRAKLISSYPKSVIATLTGLVDATLPVTGKQIAWGALPGASTSSATANAKAIAGEARTGPADRGSDGLAATAGSSGAGGATPGSVPAPAPAAAADAAAGVDAAPQFVDLMSSPNAAVVAVQDGRILRLGSSRKLGKYVILRDIYGDVFTYAGLGSIAPSYRLPKPSTAAFASVKTAAAAAASEGGDPAPNQPASAPSQSSGGPGGQSPLTLRVKRSSPQTTTSQDSVQGGSAESAPARTGKVRLFANPGNPDARAAAARVTSTTPRAGADGELPLRRGALVAEGTVLGHVRVPHGARDGHLRFAIQPAGDPGAIAPSPVLENWKQLDAALHPQGAKGQNDLLGATASDVFLLSKSQLERTVLSDPGIQLDVRARHEIAAGAIDRRVLAVLAFLSRVGLKPTVSGLQRGVSGRAARSGHVSARVRGNDADTGGAVDITQVNGVPIAGHEGAGSIADITIRALLTLRGEFAPSQIVSLMKYPGAANTLSTTAHSNEIHIDFQPAAAVAAALTPATAARTAHAASAGRTSPSPFVTSGALTLTQWNELIARVGALPAPTVAAKPSSAAIRDR